MVAQTIKLVEKDESDKPEINSEAFARELYDEFEGHTSIGLSHVSMVIS